jgi:ribosomal protein L19
MLSVLKTQIRNKLTLMKDVFEASVIDQSLQSVIQSQLHTHFKPQMAGFNCGEDAKHCNKTNEVRRGDRRRGEEFNHWVIQRKAFLMQNCAALMERSVTSIIDVFVPVFNKAVDRVAKLFTQSIQGLDGILNHFCY